MKRSFLRVFCICPETEDTNAQRGMLITLDLVSQTKAPQSCLTKTKIHLVAVGCWYIIVLCPQVGCCNYIIHVEITIIILEHKNKKRAYGNAQTISLLQALTHKGHSCIRSCFFMYTYMHQIFGDC